jgi:hypothetical protein
MPGGLAAAAARVVAIRQRTTPDTHHQARHRGFRACGPPLSQVQCTPVRTHANTVSQV